MDDEHRLEKRRELFEALNEVEWRAPVLLDIILNELSAFKKPTTVVEIGCGVGFDADLPLQRKLASHIDQFIGVEPDTSVKPQDIYTSLFRTYLEDAEIPDSSVDIAFSIMVMEHVENPESFMESVLRILKPGGVYWGFTVHKHHWFTSVAHLFSKAGLKTFYLQAVHGKNNESDLYIDYPTTYLLNTPEAIEKLVPDVSNFESWGWGRSQTAGMYAPGLVTPLVDAFENRRISRGGHRTGLAVRIVK